MLDVLFIPAALLLALALRAARDGDHRLHGHLMAAGFTVVGLRLLLRPRALPSLQLGVCLALFALTGATLLLGRRALAWREGRSRGSWAPRVHRGAGRFTLLASLAAVIVWLLRDRG